MLSVKLHQLINETIVVLGEKNKINQPKQKIPHDYLFLQKNECYANVGL